MNNELDHVMIDSKTSAELEFEATRAMHSALEPLDEAARARVVSHVAAMLNIAEAPMTSKGTAVAEENQIVADVATPAPPVTFKTFAELFDAAQPGTEAQKALVAGYWIQECEGADSFDGQRANKELNHLGHRASNITVAVGGLINQKPSLAIQLRKSGLSQQARKTYKITAAGIVAVRAMING
jgi:hypothetical protein